MRLLLDTHMFLWFLSEESRIPEETREAIESSANSVLVSAASVWEIAIKASIGRLKIARTDVMKLPALIDASGFDELPVRARHAAASIEAAPPRVKATACAAFGPRATSGSYAPAAPKHSGRRRRRCSARWVRISLGRPSSFRVKLTYSTHLKTCRRGTTRKTT